MNTATWNRRWNRWLIALPACCGVVLILIAAVTASRQPLTPHELRAWCAWAVPLALAGCAAALPLPGACLVWAVRGQTRKAALSVAALLTYLGGFAWAGAGSPGFLFIT